MTCDCSSGKISYKGDLGEMLCASFIFILLSQSRFFARRQLLLNVLCLFDYFSCRRLQVRHRLQVLVELRLQIVGLLQIMKENSRQRRKRAASVCHAPTTNAIMFQHYVVSLPVFLSRVLRSFTSWFFIYLLNKIMV